MSGDVRVATYVSTRGRYLIFNLHPPIIKSDKIKFYRESSQANTMTSSPKSCGHCNRCCHIKGTSSTEKNPSATKKINKIRRKMLASVIQWYLASVCIICFCYEAKCSCGVCALLPLPIAHAFSSIPNVIFPKFDITKLSPRWNSRSSMAARPTNVIHQLSMSLKPAAIPLMDSGESLFLLF